VGIDTAVTVTLGGSDATLLLNLAGLTVEQVARGGGALDLRGVRHGGQGEYVCTRPPDLPGGGGSS
jgi:hypothetical protein